MKLRRRIIAAAVKNPDEYELVDQNVIHIKLLHTPTRSWQIHRISGKDIDKIEEDLTDAEKGAILTE